MKEEAQAQEAKDGVETAEGDKKLSKVEQYFAHGNRLLTLQNSSLVINDDTRRLVALFSDGTFLVSENHKFDGRVMSFQVLAVKKNLIINKPIFVTQNQLNAVYSLGERINVSRGGVETDLELLQMQKDFINIVQRAAINKVSDVHVVISDTTTMVMFRRDGVMQTEVEYNRDWGESFVRAVFASADVSDANYAQKEYQSAQKLGATPLKGSKGKLMLPHNVLAVRLQFNPIAFGSRYLIMRLLYADDNPDGSGDLSSLGFGEYEENYLYKLRAVPIGLSVISGPTGSGKSTTLQRNLIKLLQDKNYEINLITVEDPPEYPIPGAKQMPVTNVNSEQERDEEFTKALSAALRSDPDVIMVGEIRALAAAQLTFKGALSGHGMWTTLHANSAPAIITRFRDMGVEDFKLADPELMKGLISQRLFRQLCPNCKVKALDRRDETSVKRLKTALGDFGLESSYLRGPGCSVCDNKGFSGRQAVAEFVLPDKAFLDYMIRGETGKAIDYWTGDMGGRTLKEAAIERMLKGLVDIEEVERWCGLLDQRPVY